MTEEQLLDADSAQAALAHFLMKYQKRDIVTLTLVQRGTRFANGESGREVEFFYFVAGENDGWYVHRDDGFIEQDENCIKKS